MPIFRDVKPATIGTVLSCSKEGRRKDPLDQIYPSLPRLTFFPLTLPCDFKVGDVVQTIVVDLVLPVRFRVQRVFFGCLERQPYCYVVDNLIARFSSTQNLGLAVSR